MPVEEYDYEKAMESLGNVLRILNELVIEDEDKFTVEDVTKFNEAKDFFEDRSGETIG